MQPTSVLPSAPERIPAPPVPEPAPPRRAAKAWMAAAALFAGVVLLVEWTDRPPAPAPADVPAAEFSEARARPVLEHLAGGIGLRMIGTTGRDSAAAYLAALLREIPGVEVRVQEWSGARPSVWNPHVLELYHARNVLARIPGDSASSVLVSAHYDSPAESVGAGDNALGVAASVEVLRALAAGPRPRHSVVVNFNDGEEAGLLGSGAFLDDPWVRDVRAFVNLESAGPRGKAVLFQAGPGNDWLTEAYARSVPRPYGTVVGQDIFQSGVIPSDTDFRVYRDEGGLRGLDIALYQDGYAYHTGLDRVERVQPGSLQHMGDNTLALVRELAGGPLPGDVGGTPSVYYDLLGATMFAYSAGTARLLAGLALLLALGAVAFALVRTPLTAGRMLAGLGVTLLAGTAGLLLPLAAGLVVALAFGRGHGWYAAPWLGWAAFGALALAGFLFVHGIWERVAGRKRPAEETALAALAGGTVAWGVVLALFTWGGIGSGYVPLWWTLAGTAGLVLWTVLPERRWIALAAAWVLPALLTVQVQLVLLKLFAPVAGRFPAGIPFDPVIALVVAVPMVWLAVMGAAPLHRAGRLGRASAVLAGVGAAGLLALTLVSPYTSERPKRLRVQHEVGDTTSGVWVSGMDWPGVPAVLAGVEGEPFREGRSSLVHGRPAPRPELPALPVSFTGEAADEAGGERTVRFRVAPNAPSTLTLRLPADRLAGWSLAGSLPPLPEGTDTYTVRILPSPAGWEGTLRVRGAEPVEAEVAEAFAPARTPAIDAVLRGLPAWTTAQTSVRRNGTITF